MNKSIRIFLIFMMFTAGVYAQSNTYQIEKLSKPEELLPTVPPNKLFSSVDKNFLKLSVTGDLVDLGTRPLITGYLKAYQNHYPITISPEIAWLLICQGFSHHVNSDSEKLRTLLVNFSDKKDLSVIRNVNGIKDIAAFPWESIFPEFEQQISAYTGPELTENLSANFTTTTSASRIAGQITIMESMKEFFNYKVIMIGCGLPEVTVEGSIEDWEKINKGLDFLSRYDLEWWTSELKPVIQKIIETKKGKLDKDFWMNMVKYHKTGVYGSYDGIDGWLLKFYPYLENRVSTVKAAKTSQASGQIQGFISTSKAKYSKSFIRSEFKEIKNIYDLPKELACVPFIFEVQDNDKNIVSKYKMEFWAGFMGVKQDSRNFNIKPEIGWAVNVLSKQ